jgi:hypothetical protein
MKLSLKKKAFAGALAVASFGVLSVNAMGMPGMNTLSADEIASRQTAMFQQQATLIGATVDEVKASWANGESLSDLAKAKGLTQEQLQAKMKAQHDLDMKAELQTLVTKGVITQAQADKRIAAMAIKETNKGKGFGKGGHKKSHSDMMGGFGF